jgi:alkylated DNA repair dioxygenase AlkB
MDTKRLAGGISYFPGFAWNPDETFAWTMGELECVQRTTRAYGKMHRVPRQEAWFGQAPYTFSGHTFPAQAEAPELVGLAIRIENLLGIRTIGCLVNKYADGSDSVAWHSDDDHAEAGIVVATVSLGATRRFRLRRKVPTAPVASAILPNDLSVDLEHGSLIVMGEGVQDDWLHCIPKAKNKGPRVSLTFRGVRR